VGRVGTLSLVHELILLKGAKLMKQDVFDTIVVFQEVDVPNIQCKKKTRSPADDGSLGDMFVTSLNISENPYELSEKSHFTCGENCSKECFLN
jgi:hypothetical protein